MNIGAKLKSIRKSKGLSFYRITQDSDIPQHYLKKIEESAADNAPNISLDVLERLCAALGVPVSDFLNENEEVSYLTAKEKAMISIFRRFSVKEQDACLSFMDLVSGKQA